MAGLVGLSGDNPIRSIGKSPVDNGKGSFTRLAEDLL